VGFAGFSKVEMVDGEMAFVAGDRLVEECGFGPMFLERATSGECQ
jgi:hypothetical protein